MPRHEDVLIAKVINYGLGILVTPTAAVTLLRLAAQTSSEIITCDESSPMTTAHFLTRAIFNTVHSFRLDWDIGLGLVLFQPNSNDSS